MVCGARIRMDKGLYRVQMMAPIEEACPLGFPKRLTVAYTQSVPVTKQHVSIQDNNYDSLTTRDTPSYWVPWTHGVRVSSGAKYLDIVHIVRPMDKLLRAAMGYKHGPQSYDTVALLW